VYSAYQLFFVSIEGERAMHPTLFKTTTSPVCPVWVVDEASWPDVNLMVSSRAQQLAKGIGFIGHEGSHVMVWDERGTLESVLMGLGKHAEDADPFVLAKLHEMLPQGDYELAFCPLKPDLAFLGFVLGRYRFERYKALPLKAIRLKLMDGVDGGEITRIANGIALGRDLINTPANDCSPQALEEAARQLAKANDANIHVIIGDDLLTQNFPMIHAVGRASADIPARIPRLIDLKWQPKGQNADDLLEITLVGKGVCFDTGGLNIKPDNSMLLMKKDMGGAASVLAAASMIMDAQLPLRLRVLIPAVENAISGDAFRPGDVLKSRKGVTVEIGNTDAEGRLVLADALTFADESDPDLIIDMATLTGAARVALGPDLPPLMCEDDALAATLQRIGSQHHDPVWRLPLWNPYESLLSSKVADTNNVSSGSYAGSILAALFLRKFISPKRAWAHFDIFGWTPSSKPARPEGGEAQAARLIYAYLKERVGV
jgi:leucyl aminopeptidase